MSIKVLNTTASAMDGIMIPRGSTAIIEPSLIGLLYLHLSISGTGVEPGVAMTPELFNKFRSLYVPDVILKEGHLLFFSRNVHDCPGHIPLLDVERGHRWDIPIYRLAAYRFEDG